MRLEKLRERPVVEGVAVLAGQGRAPRKRPKERRGPWRRSPPTNAVLHRHVPVYPVDLGQTSDVGNAQLTGRVPVGPKMAQSVPGARLAPAASVLGSA